MVTEFVFIRHGETDWNRQQRWQGHTDVPLNAIGLAQAARLGERLADEPGDLLLASDLQRARQTAQPLATAWAMAPVLESGFREQNFGMLEGLDAPTIKARHADIWSQWLEHRADYAPPGGESLAQFHARVIAAVRAAAEQHPGQRLVVVTHGGVLDMLWRTAHGLSLHGLRQCEIPNTGINRLRWNSGTLDILQWAEADHLQGLPEQPSTAAGER
jgi:2,3-bisphosphoglycerate-dependent phosphoglycerate mutase